VVDIVTILLNGSLRKKGRKREREILLDPSPLSLPFFKKILSQVFFLFFFIGLNGERGF
jgi:hypothetical protein